MHRFLGPAAIVAALLVGTAAPVGAASAQGALPKREITSEVITNQDNQLVLKGNVSPGHAERKVFVQKRNCLKPKCDWHHYNTVVTNEFGVFRSRIGAPRKGSDYYRAKVVKYGGYGTSYSQVWRTWTD